METTAIRQLTAADLPDAARLLGLLNPDTPPRLIRERLATLVADHPHYHLIGAFAGNSLVGVCGAWIATKIWCGRYLEIDNLVVDPEQRSAGTGTRLISHLESIAREKNCLVLVMDTYTGNHASHRLYHRLGFEIWGFHFIKPLGDWAGRDRA